MEFSSLNLDQKRRITGLFDASTTRWRERRRGKGWSGRNHLKPSTQATNPTPATWTD